MNGDMPRTLPEPASTERIRSRPRPHDPQEPLIAPPVRRRTSPPATGRSQSHPVDPPTWTVDLATSADMHTRGRTLRDATPISLSTNPSSASIKPAPTPPPAVGKSPNPHRPQRRARPPRVPCMGPWLSSTYFTAGLTSFRVSWFDLEARFFVPTHRSRTLARAGAVKIGRRSSLPPSSVAVRPHLYGPEHAGTLVVVGMTPSRGARRSRRDVHRTTTLYSVGQETRTMMQSCASAAKLRAAGPFFTAAWKPWVWRRVTAPLGSSSADRSLGCQDGSSVLPLF
jgi:hypothetical protein